MTREEQMMAAAEEYSGINEEYSQDKIVEMNAFAAGWQQADSHPNWISVEEELPKRLLSVEPIIDVIMANGICVGQGTYNDITGQWHWYATGAIANDITHWMPLPQPPRKEDKK